jgi:hypothetical protein
MDGNKVLTEITPKLSLLNNDITLTFQFVNLNSKEIPNNLNFEAKVL